MRVSRRGAIAGTFVIAAVLLAPSDSGPVAHLRAHALTTRSADPVALISPPSSPVPPTVEACPPSTSETGHTNRAPGITGWLHTCGTTIYDGNDHPVRLLSMSAGGLAVGSGHPGDAEKAVTGCKGYGPPLPGAYANIAAWGFNSVRLPIAWADLEPTPPTTGPTGVVHHHYNQAYVSLVDQVVHGFEGHGVAVILDMHQAYWSPAFKHLRTHGGSMCQGTGMPAWLYHTSSNQQDVGPAELSFFANKGPAQAGFLDAWRFFARRYANDRMVIGADMLNEPVTHRMFPPSQLHLNLFYAHAGQAIRSVNPHLLLIFEDNNYLGTNGFALTGPVPFENAVYSFHLYARTIALGMRESEAYWARAKDWNVPLWNGEWDLFDASSSTPHDPTWQGDTRTAMAFYRQNGIGWAIWTYAHDSFLTAAGEQPKPGMLDAVQQGF